MKILAALCLIMLIASGKAAVAQSRFNVLVADGAQVLGMVPYELIEDDGMIRTVTSKAYVLAGNALYECFLGTAESSSFFRNSDGICSPLGEN